MDDPHDPQPQVNPEEPFAAAPSAPSRRKIPTAWIIGGAAALAVGAAVAIPVAIRTAGPDPAAGPNILQAAKTTCKGAAELGDNGRTLIIDGRGKENYAGEPIEKLACYLKEVNTPDYVISQMDGTRALDGRQTAEWAGIHASWTYHPDQGMNLTLTLR